MVVRVPEESIHYKRKTGRAFARADMFIFRTVEWKNEPSRAYIYIAWKKKWAGVRNVISHKQDQLIFMRTNERVTETAVSRIIKIKQGKQTVTREPVR